MIKFKKSLLNARNLGQELEELPQFVRDQEEYAFQISLATSDKDYMAV